MRAVGSSFRLGSLVLVPVTAAGDHNDDGRADIVAFHDYDNGNRLAQSAGLLQ
jgi:hypothetical protein